VTLNTEVGKLVADTSQSWTPGIQLLVAIRPERMRLHLDDPQSAGNLVPAYVDRLMFVGESVDCHLRVGARNWVARQDPHLTPDTGSQVWLELPQDGLSLIAGGAA